MPGRGVGVGASESPSGAIYMRVCVYALERGRFSCEVVSVTLELRQWRRRSRAMLKISRLSPTKFEQPSGRKAHESCFSKGTHRNAVNVEASDEDGQAFGISSSRALAADMAIQVFQNYII